MPLKHLPLSSHNAFSQTFPVIFQLLSPFPGSDLSIASAFAPLAIVPPVFSLLSRCASRCFPQLSVAITLQASLLVQHLSFQSLFSSYRPRLIILWPYWHSLIRIPFTSGSFFLLLPLPLELFEHFPSPISKPSFSLSLPPYLLTLSAMPPHESMPYVSSHHLSISWCPAHAASSSALTPVFLLFLMLPILSVHSSIWFLLLYSSLLLIIQFPSITFALFSLLLVTLFLKLKVMATWLFYRGYCVNFLVMIHFCYQLILFEIAWHQI